MFETYKLLTACFIGLLLSATASAQINRVSETRGQTAFAMETPIRRPYRVPSYVVEQIVRNDDTEEPDRRKAAAADLQMRLQGSLVNLNNDGKPDFLVQGDDGANITGFWLFMNLGQKWRLVLATRAFGISVDKTYTNGVRDVSLEAASAASIWGATYKFDLDKYVPRECWEQSVNGRSRKKKYFKCSEDSQKPYR